MPEPTILLRLSPGSAWGVANALKRAAYRGRDRGAANENEKIMEEIAARLGLAVIEAQPNTPPRGMGAWEVDLDMGAPPTVLPCGIESPSPWAVERAMTLYDGLKHSAIKTRSWEEPEAVWRSRFVDVIARALDAARAA